MNLIRKFGLWAFFVVVASSPAYADVVLTCKHDLVSIQPEGAGSLLSFSITISNSGTSSLGYAKLVAKDPLAKPEAVTNTRSIGALPAGDTVAFDWIVTSSLPTDQLTPGMDLPFNIDVEAADEAGNLTIFQVTSKGGEL